MIATWKLTTSKVYHGLNSTLGQCVHKKTLVLPTQMVPISVLAHGLYMIARLPVRNFIDWLNAKCVNGYWGLVSLIQFRPEFLSGVWAPTGLVVDMSLSALTYFLTVGYESYRAMRTHEFYFLQSWVSSKYAYFNLMWRNYWIFVRENVWLIGPVSVLIMTCSHLPCHWAVKCQFCLTTTCSG